MADDEVDPSEFVQRIRALGEQRDQQDAERVRKLEEEIIQGRSERLARRAERARSLSPDKPTTPNSLRTGTDTPRSLQEKAADSPTPTMEPPSATQDSAREDSLQRLTGSPAQALEDLEPKKPTPSAAALGRSGTLSWQRRPQSGLGSVRRPLSSAFSPTSADRSALASPRDTPEPSPPAIDSAASRDQIAQSLGGKDPSWFKQTPDRGIGSAAYRRSQEDTLSDTDSIARKPLPGMSRESTAEPEPLASPPASLRSTSPSRPSSVRGSVLGNRFHGSTSVSSIDIDALAKTTRSPLPVLDSHKFAPPASELDSSIDGGDNTGSVRGLAMSPTQGRISPERERPVSPTRPASPTKGMGGFVQSAMLKRSDSVSKRWSTQTPQTLTRQNSTLSNRASATIGYGTLSKLDRPTSLSRDNSIEPASRPSSSSSNMPFTKDTPGTESTPRGEFVKPALPHHSRSKSVASTFSEDQKTLDDPMSPPSPSKRWSPTKSSWLESALSRPESPKPRLPPPQQPSWMAELSQKRQQRGSVDLGKGANIPFETTPSGRSSPIKDVQLRPVSLRRAESPMKEILEFGPQLTHRAEAKPVEKALPGKLVNSRPESLRALDLPKTEEAVNPVQLSPKRRPLSSAKSSFEIRTELKEDSKEEPKVDVKQESKESPVVEPKAELEEAQKLEPKVESTTEPGMGATVPDQPPRKLSEPVKDSPATTRIRPSSISQPFRPDNLPKNDFRASLRARQPASDASKNNEVSEFQNVFGRLKKTETKNYVAPDVFKQNITRGKEALTVTGGPKPSVRRDELKESLISQKSAMLAKAQEVGSAALKKPEPLASATPEALARRRTLTRSESPSKPAPKEKDEVLEALARKKSLRSLNPVAPEKEAQPSSSAPLKEPIRSSKLADRFNPALASMLARGPPAPSKSSSPSEGSAIETTSRPPASEKAGPAPELTHMTKGRARGPKRRAPAAKKEPAAEEDTPVKVSPVAAAPMVKADHALTSNGVTKTNIVSGQPAVTRTPARESLRAKPSTPAKSPELARKMEKSPTPEPPRKPTSLELGRRASAEVAPAPGQLVDVDVSELSKPTASPKTESWRSSRALPTPATKADVVQVSSPVVKTPHKPVLLELKRTISAEIAVTPEKRVEIGSPKSGKPATSPKPEGWRSSRVLPTPSTKPEVAQVSSPPLEKTLQTPLPTKPAESKSPEPAALSPTPSWRISRPLPEPPSKRDSQDKQAPVSNEIPPPETSPTREDPSPTKLGFSVKAATSLWGRQSPSPTSAPTKAPIKLPTREDEQAVGGAEENTDLTRSPPPLEKAPSPSPQAPPKPAGLGLGSFAGFGGFVARRAKSRESTPPVPVAVEGAAPVSPPTTGDRPFSEPFKASPMPEKPDGVFSEYFNDDVVTEAELPSHIDTLQILKSPPFDLGPGGKIRTLSKQIQEITGDGKLLSIPMAEEHVLYEDSMYVCTHTFSDSKGVDMTEVYLWSGKGVADATLEDVQLFGRNIAKQNSAKLTIMRQGKETPNFFEALGGIVLTRRGSPSGSRSTEYILCGRRHLNHIAFDEVDFSLKSLCSGFAYIISTSKGKVFLWKGRGCSAEELSAARLMGMDLAPTGDFIEVEEGSEPSSLLAVFPPQEPSSKAPAIPRSAEHWRYKATTPNYRARLYKMEQQQGSSGWGQGLQVSSLFAPLLRRPSWQAFSSNVDKETELRPQTPLTPRTPRSPVPSTTTKVVEIMPFSQSDLEPEYIYVLDAFFEMYIIVGSLSRSQAAAFSTALLFAQEYGMLAVAEEDRPCMPTTTIVLEGTPRDMKAVFRFWDDRLIPAAGLMTGKLGRGKSLRIMGLAKAMEATRRA